MALESINPYTLETIETFRAHTEEETKQIIEQAHGRFLQWRHTSFDERKDLMHRAAEVLEKNQQKYAEAMVKEMGKPISEARAEIKKCAWACRFYADNAEDFLAPETIPTDAQNSFVRYDPLGAVLAIMPWNFPFWQVFRFAAPTLMAGNTALLKHASNVSRCAKHIQDIFTEAGFPGHVFQTLLLPGKEAEKVIDHPLVMAVSLTGSERAGESVAARAGKNLKPSLLELGGSNAFIVLADADIDKAVELGVNARMLNTGQSCIASKRFIIEKSIYDRYVDAFTEKMKSFQFVDPMDENAKIGPLARVDLAEKLEDQVRRSVEKGAKLLCGGKREDARYWPTVLKYVKPGMPAFDEELFGPVAAMAKAEDFEDAIHLSNQSSFGLGASVCTQNVEQVLKNAHRFNEGAVFINELVKSDPRLPFGGVKRSGYGRELSRHGIMAFVNAKTVYVK